MRWPISSFTFTPLGCFVAVAPLSLSITKTLSRFHTLSLSLFCRALLLNACMYMFVCVRIIAWFVAVAHQLLLRRCRCRSLYTTTTYALVCDSILSKFIRNMFQKYNLKWNAKTNATTKKERERKSRRDNYYYHYYNTNTKKTTMVKKNTHKERTSANKLGLIFSAWVSKLLVFSRLFFLLFCFVLCW